MMTGSRTISISQLSGVATGAFAARLWLPPSQNSAKDGPQRDHHGGSNAASIMKEFIPDCGRAVSKKYKKSPPQSEKAWWKCHNRSETSCQPLCYSNRERHPVPVM